MSKPLSISGLYAIGTTWSILATGVLCVTARNSSSYTLICLAFLAALYANLIIGIHLWRYVVAYDRYERQQNFKTMFGISCGFLAIMMLFDVPFIMMGGWQRFGIPFVTAFLLLIQGPAFAWFQWCFSTWVRRRSYH